MQADEQPVETLVPDRVLELLKAAVGNLHQALEDQFSPTQKVDSSVFEMPGGGAPISLDQYIARLSKHSGVCGSFLVYAYVYVLRAQRQKGVRLDESTAFKLLAAASIAAIKFHDNYAKRKLHYFSKLLGLNFWKIRELEISFNNQLDYDFFVEPQEFDRALAYLAEYDPAAQPPVAQASEPVCSVCGQILAACRPHAVEVSPVQVPISIGTATPAESTPQPSLALDADSLCGRPPQFDAVSVSTLTSLASPTPYRAPQIQRADSTLCSQEHLSENLDADEEQVEDDIFGGQLSPAQQSEPEGSVVEPADDFTPDMAAEDDPSDIFFGALAASAAKLDLGPSRGQWDHSSRGGHATVRAFSGGKTDAGSSAGSSLIAAFYSSSDSRRRVTWH